MMSKVGRVAEVSQGSSYPEPPKKFILRYPGFSNWNKKGVTNSVHHQLVQLIIGTFRKSKKKMRHDSNLATSA